MTLIIRIVTPQGLVLCSDSMVTYHDTISNILDVEETSRVGELLNAGDVTPDSPPTILNPQWKSDRQIVRNTAQNVTKTAGILELPIAMSIAGSNIPWRGNTRKRLRHV